MARYAGTKKSEAAVYILPWLFAKACPNKGLTDIIWPEDGAIVSPMCFLAKKTNKKEVDMIIDFLTGKEFALKTNESCFLAANSESINGLPENAKLKWIGWDYIHNNDIEFIKSEVQRIFIENWKR